MRAGLFGAGILTTAALVLLPGGLSPNQTVIDPDGEGVLDFALPDLPSDIAGIQGTLWYDPRVLEGLEPQLAPGQPASFIVDFHEPEPGELKFVLWSPDATLNPSLPVLRCRVVAPEADPEGLESVIVSDVRWTAGLDGVLQTTAEQYINLEVRQDPGTGSVDLWVIR